MSAVTIEQFERYFFALNEFPPYPWQCDLARRCVSGDWPGALDLPTGSGKTGCLDIAVFALACQATLPAAERTTPRRIFFCVNRRVIVDAAHQRALRIAERIANAEREGTGILNEIARALRAIAGTADRKEAPPLDVLELRGGIYRDNRWARSCRQPTIVCTTVDQIGSRLLFRGYGVSPNAAPIHAALIAYDSLILLDEAHISEPFRQTLDLVADYLDAERWAEVQIGPRPFVFLPMTATPNKEMIARGVIRLTEGDRQEERLDNRLVARKPAKLINAKDVAKIAVSTAIEFASGEPKAIGIIVNRVATAREIYHKLCVSRANTGGRKPKVPDDAVIELVIGSMRPIDRDRQADLLAPLVGPDRPKPRSEQTSFVVSTQCLEVGADYDFDHLITECASIDALRQRFGRLNRSGRKDGDDDFIDADSVILANGKDIKPDDKLDDDKPADPIYGNALARTWNWLDRHAEVDTVDGKPIKRLDFGVDSFNSLLERYEEDGRFPANLLAPSASLSAPTLMPAYLDLLCQTNPRPKPDPDVSRFLHGSRSGEPDVQVCWRADLVDDDVLTRQHWPDVVALLPPTSAECMRIPISRMRNWLKNAKDTEDQSGDLPGHMEEEDDRDSRPSAPRLPGVVLWRGVRDSTLLESIYDLKPGDTVVLPVESRKSDSLGHLPELHVHAPGPSDPSPEDLPKRSVVDHAEIAFCRARDQASLRLHPALRDRLGPAFEGLLEAVERLDEEPLNQKQWREHLAEIDKALPEDHELKVVVHALSSRKLHVERYSDERGVVLKSRELLGQGSGWFPAFADEGGDEASLIERGSVLLSEHSRHVATVVENDLRYIATASVDTRLFVQAAELHDLGKADERFQAMLKRTDRTEAWLSAGAESEPLAKSDRAPQTFAQRKEAHRRSGLPNGFRHEMLSMQLAEFGGLLPDRAKESELVLHLVAAHHGFARPLAPVVLDEELPEVRVDGVTLEHENRAALTPPHRLDSGVADRFWRLTRRYGWWGLAYLEAVLRLADWQASADEASGRFEHRVNEGNAERGT